MDRRNSDRWGCPLTPSIRNKILNNYINRISRQAEWRNANKLNRTKTITRRLT